MKQDEQRTRVSQSYEKAIITASNDQSASQ